MTYPVFLLLTIVAPALMAAVAGLIALRAWFGLRTPRARSSRRSAVQQDSQIPPRLEVFLLSPQAPELIRLPVHLSRTRMLEVRLPLRLLWTGINEVGQLDIRVTLPNAITYGGSLDQMVREPLHPGLSGARPGYSFGNGVTSYHVRAHRLAARTPVIVMFPLAIKPRDAGVWPVSIEIRLAGRVAARLTHRIEVVDVSRGPVTPPSGAWTGIPDERTRTRDQRLPLDRVRVEARG